MILTQEPDLEVVGEADDGLAAVEMATQLKPDVAVVDIEMPGLNDIEAMRRIKAALPKIQVLSLSMHASDIYVFQVLKAGGSGYVQKRAAATDLVGAIRAAHSGKAFRTARCSFGTRCAKVSSSLNRHPRPLDRRRFSVPHSPVRRTSARGASR